MRVAHILRKLDPGEWSGTEMATQRLFEGLRSQGATPVAFCPRLSGTSNGDPLVQDGFEVRRFKAFIPIMGLSAERKRQLVSVGGNLMSFDLLRRLWRERPLSLIHAHSLGRLGGVALTVAKRRHLPFVVTIHGGVFDLPESLKDEFNAPQDDGFEWGKLLGVLFQSRRLFVDADAILTCNGREAALLKEQLPGKRVVVQPHGVPVEIYQKDQREAAQAAFPQIRGRKIVLSVGRIDPVKNQAWLIERAPQIFAKNSRAVLVLAGPCTDAPYGSRLNRMITDNGLSERVLLTGGLPAYDPRLIGLLQTADALVLPSLSETFGLVILEAWAAGTPVISARASGPAALIQHGQNGWLFDLADLAGFHRALDVTLENPEPAKEMARRGAKLAQMYSIRALAGQLKRLYQELIDEKQVRSARGCDTAEPQPCTEN